MIDGTCGLCSREATLLDSHLIPNAIYRKLWVKKDKSLVTIDKGSITYNTKQIRQHLLCRSCEQLFSQPYEQRVINQCASEHGFGLKQLTKDFKPIKYGYLESTDKELCNIYHYFACSILWRALTPGWRGYKINKLSDMPEDHKMKLTNELKKYLLNKNNKPENIIVTVYVDKSIKPYRFINLPSTDYFENSFHCEFSIPGVIFHIFRAFDNINIESNPILKEDKVLFIRHKFPKHLSFEGVCLDLKTAIPRGKLAKELSMQH